jgi:predicted patatin/cPLA2 family phospholipase
MDHVDYDELEWLRASASMPLASKVVEVQGRKLLDGGVSDSIPLEYYEQQGYDRNVVILTQPLGYQKEHNRLMPLMRLALKKYPHFLKALDERHLMYNKQLEYVVEAEKEGRCLVIRPDKKIPIGHLSHDPQQMRLVYEQGREVGERYIEKIKTFYTCELISLPYCPKCWRASFTNPSSPVPRRRDWPRYVCTTCATTHSTTGAVVTITPMVVLPAW